MSQKQPIFDNCFGMFLFIGNKLNEKEFLYRLGQKFQKSIPGTDFVSWSDLQLLPQYILFISFFSSFYFSSP